MLLSILSGGNAQDIVISLLLSLPIILFALTLHETAHGFVAWKCGDPTAHNLGRLTLNPAKHLDPIGVLSMLIFGFGWAKPVPINTRYFRKPKRGMALTALAGPAANFLLGLISAVLTGLFFVVYHHVKMPAFLTNCVYWTFQLFQYSALYNFLFMAFNLIPCPPFDGSRIALSFLPTKTYFSIMRYERQIMIGVLVAVIILSNFGYSPFSWVASELTVRIANGVLPFFRSLIVH